MYRTTAERSTHPRTETFVVERLNRSERWGMYAFCVILPFLVLGKRTHWSSETRSMFIALALIGVVGLFVVTIGFRPFKIIVDHGLRSVVVLNRCSFSFDEIGAAEIVPILERTKSGEVSVTRGTIVLNKRRGSETVELVTGSLETLNPVVTAIRKAIGQIQA